MNTIKEQSINCVAPVVGPLLSAKLDFASGVFGLKRGTVQRRYSSSVEHTPMTVAELLVGLENGLFDADTLNALFSEYGIICVKLNADFHIPTALACVGEYQAEVQRASSDNIISHTEKPGILRKARKALPHMLGMAIHCFKTRRWGTKVWDQRTTPPSA